MNARAGVRPWAVVGAFTAPAALLEAAARVRGAGFTRLDAYAPYPVEGLAEALGMHRNAVPAVFLAAGLLGGLTGYGMQWFASVIHYPINVGGRPLHSWPAFVPITFELTVLFAGLGGVLGMLALNRLPRLHHPVFETPHFERASRDLFLLCVMADDPLFDEARARRVLDDAGAGEVHLVEA